MKTNSIVAKTILISDDHPLFRQALRAAVLPLFGDAEIVEVETLAETQQVLEACGVDLLLLDLRMSDSKGLAGVMIVKGSYPEVPLIVVSALVTLGAINVANPERIIALDNIHRDHDALFWHLRLGQFTGDGQVVLAAELDRLSPELAKKVTTELCDQYGRNDYKAGLLNANLGKWRAEGALRDLCGGTS